MVRWCLKGNSKGGVHAGQYEGDFGGLRGRQAGHEVVQAMSVEIRGVKLLFLSLAAAIGYLASLFPCALAFIMGLNVLAAACIFLFIFAQAVGQGTVIWVFISEVFPQRFRAEGQGFGSFTHWMFCATLTFVFPLMAAKWPAWSIFAFFGACLVAHLLWAAFVCPETKGRALEE